MQLKLPSRFGRKARATLEVLFIVTVRALILPLNLLYVKSRINEPTFVLCAVALQLLIAFSALYSSYKRKCISLSIDDANSKVKLLSEKSVTGSVSGKVKNGFGKGVFAAEFCMQTISSLGLTITPFFYKLEKLEMWVYLLLMVVFLVMGSFSYFVISIERYESREGLKHLNEVLDLLLKQKKKEVEYNAVEIEPVSCCLEKTNMCKQFA